jgi:uncharacterized protein (TIGR04255 family)
MSDGVPFIIDLQRKFPHLAAAPIVEAVIHWTARATKAWQPVELQKFLAARLPEYPKVDLQHYHELIFEARFEDSGTLPTASQHESWRGVKLQNEAQHYIAQFTLDGLVFSRLQPYESWEQFSTEARRLWNIFVEIAEPSEIERLGVRFINRIGSAEFGKLSQHLNEPPSFTSDLQLNGFLYQSTFDVPGHPFGIRIVKTMQPTVAGKDFDSGLIIDIDVFTSKPLSCEESILDDYLPKMRWLKNKVFFDLLTTQTIDKFKRE